MTTLHTCIKILSACYVVWAIYLSYRDYDNESLFAMMLAIWLLVFN